MNAPPSSPAVAASPCEQASRTERVRRWALEPGRRLTWSDLKLLSKEERDAYWHLQLHTPRPIFFDFTRDDIDRDYALADSRRFYEHGG